MKDYIGHKSQVSGAEELRLVGGKGDGMRLILIRNGKGLEFFVTPDRCADISRLTFKGDNLGYFAPCGYVGPSYYDDKGLGFLKSFYAGFLTTCGLSTAGAPGEDEGEALPLHGSIGNTPAESVAIEETDEKIVIRASVNQAVIFGQKLMLYREITCSKTENSIGIRDTVENFGHDVRPLMILYHFNMGYPLLSEKARLFIPSESVAARDAHAEKDLSTWDKILPPQLGFEEQCYYHSFKKGGRAGIYNPEIEKGLLMSFCENLDTLTQWKMMGCRDYVLGLEPGNCDAGGRAAARKSGKLKFIRPGEKQTFEVNFKFFEREDKWQAAL